MNMNPAACVSVCVCVFSFFFHIRCLSDAKLTGAKSYFMQRSQEDKLNFQLKAFRFHQDHRNSVSAVSRKCVCIQFRTTDGVSCSQTFYASGNFSSVFVH